MTSRCGSERIESDRRNFDAPRHEGDGEEQPIRHGRSLEFNPLHDRDSIFGLKTGGNVE
jgi:coproporphyrinogen III oxidase